ncbi:MAG: methyltransferase domain-containing protein [Rhodobacteraceae bacterium]|nr:methyltransferase domain-containing protein [Paracoccaceae bacterium]
MNDTTSAFVGNIPTNYDTRMGPVIFDHMAKRMADRAAALHPGRVLEIAAGTGIVTRHLADSLGEEVAILATDLNEPMLQVARNKLDGDARVEFQEADAQDLSFDDGVFDVVICQFGHMFFPDRPKAYAEARRVLRPGGHYVFSTWGSNAENPYSDIINQTFADTFQDDPPGFMKVPFSLNDPQTLLAEVAEAGFFDPNHEVAEHHSVVASFDDFALGMMLGSPAFFEVSERGGDHVVLARDLANRFRARFGDEPASMPLKAHFFSMTAQ